MNTVSPLPGRSDTAAVASSVVELLEVLWGGGRDLVSAPVSVSQLRVLYVLESNDGINLRTLTETLDSRPSSVSRLCDRLEAIGLVQRTASAASRRELELHLTPAGRTFLTDLRTTREQALERILDGMPGADRRALLAGLRSFRTAALDTAALDTAASGVPAAGTRTGPVGGTAGDTGASGSVHGAGAARSA